MFIMIFLPFRLFFGCSIRLVNKAFDMRRIVPKNRTQASIYTTTEQKSERENVYIPCNTMEMHLIYGDAEMNGPTSECAIVDINASSVLSKKFYGGRLRVIHIWYKPALKPPAHCTKIICFVSAEDSAGLNADANSNMQYDLRDGPVLGPNEIIDDKNFFDGDFIFKEARSEKYRFDIIIEQCNLCDWSGASCKMDNHYIQFHADKNILEDPLDGFDIFF